MIDIAEMEKTTDAIIKARRVLAEKREQVIITAWELKKQQHELLLEGVIVGKNEKERDACMWAATSGYQSALADVEKLERAAILELEVCKDIRRCQEDIIAIENVKEA